MSDSLFDPDQSATDTLRQPWDEAFRAQRDVGLLVPINYHVVPAVSLRAACFSANRYDDASFRKCFSNLLGIGLGRFVVDVYWDDQRSEWSLCPVEIPPPGSTASAPSATSSSTVASGTPSSSVNSSIVASPTSSPSPSAPVVLRDDRPPRDDGLVQLGDYQCSPTMVLSSLMGILADYLDKTATTTDATFTYLVFNLHAASSWTAPNDPARQPSDDRIPPAMGTSLSSVLKGNLSDDLYTPSELADQRTHLNDSWYNVPSDIQPRQGYYRVDVASDQKASTPDGWPDEAYSQFQKFDRLLGAIGTVDPQMSNYSLAQDEDTIFPQETIHFQDATVSSSGSVSSGCLFDASLTTITPSTNSSFALATIPSNLSIPSNPDLSHLIPSVSNLTACGLSPFLNSTLANTTADKNPLPYALFMRSYLWSWAPGQPLNATDPSSSSGTPSGNRCAAVYASGEYAGRWHVVDCSSRLRVACQDPSQPYAWHVSEETAPYSSATSACKSPLAFSVPHSALENSHLAAAIASSSSSSSDADADRAAVLIDLNSLDVPDCWVAELNGTCPYQAPGDTNQTRIVVVPAVAAVLIFVCAALTFFVKCAANRRDERRGRRRKVMEGWEYEGVPS